MKTSQKGINLIKQFEGCELEAYKCPAGIWTIGYGHTVDVYKGMKITEKEAEILLIDDLPKYEKYAQDFAINQNQFDALVSFIYNVGSGNFMKSTLRKKIMAGANEQEIRNEFAKWRRGGGKILPGLVKRRKAEADLFYQKS